MDATDFQKEKKKAIAIASTALQVAGAIGFGQCTGHPECLRGIRVY
jgi:hypothetical protein